MKHEEVKRGKLIYYITDTSVTVNVGGMQYLSYNVYNTPSRANLAEFKKKIKKSKPTDYGNAVELMMLAQQCKVIGSGTRKPDWIG